MKDLWHYNQTLESISNSLRSQGCNMQYPKKAIEKLEPIFHGHIDGLAFNNSLSNLNNLIIIPWSTMKPEKMKSLSEEKVRYYFLQKSKISLLHCFWAILSTISLQDLCMKMMWPQVDFCSGNTYITLLKKIQIPKILPMWGFVPLK